MTASASTTVALQAAETLLLPDWAAALLLLVTVPLGLAAGYLAFRGLRRGSRPTARALALGLVLLTAVDAALGFSVSLGGTELLTRSSPVVRAAVRSAGLLLILYAIYTPSDADRGGER
jgi:arginine exporter protein ArgO